MDRLEDWWSTADAQYIVVYRHLRTTLALYARPSLVSGSARRLVLLVYDVGYRLCGEYYRLSSKAMHQPLRSASLESAFTLFSRFDSISLVYSLL